jgi:hypothetical protein
MGRQRQTLQKFLQFFSKIGFRDKKAQFSQISDREIKNGILRDSNPRLIFNLQEVESSGEKSWNAEESYDDDDYYDDSDDNDDKTNVR